MSFEIDRKHFRQTIPGNQVKKEMNRSITPAKEIAPPCPAGPLSLLSAIMRHVFLWLVVFVLALLSLGCRFLRFTIRLVFRFSFTILVYLILATMLLGAVILMLGFHSLTFMNGGHP